MGARSNDDLPLPELAVFKVQRIVHSRGPARLRDRSQKTAWRAAVHGARSARVARSRAVAALRRRPAHQQPPQLLPRPGRQISTCQARRAQESRLDTTRRECHRHAGRGVTLQPCHSLGHLIQPAVARPGTARGQPGCPVSLSALDQSRGLLAHLATLNRNQVRVRQHPRDRADVRRPDRAHLDVATTPTRPHRRNRRPGPESPTLVSRNFGLGSSRRGWHPVGGRHDDQVFASVDSRVSAVEQPRELRPRHVGGIAGTEGPGRRGIAGGTVLEVTAGLAGLPVHLPQLAGGRTEHGQLG
jgi:hypothetical protein